jgi:hypothetical protein
MQKILRAVAMPSQLYWAPQLPAIINMIAHSLLMIYGSGLFEIKPPIFVLSFLCVHVGIALWLRRVPHVTTLIKAWLISKRGLNNEDFLQFNAILPDGKTLSCRDGTLSRYLEITPLSGTLTPQEKGLDLRKNWINQLENSGVLIRSFSIQERRNTVADYINSSSSLQDVAQSSYGRRQFLMLSISKKVKDADSALLKAVETTKISLQDYTLQDLSQNSTDVEKTPLSFISKLCSPLSKQRVSGVDARIFKQIQLDKVKFDHKGGFITFSQGTKSFQCSVYSLQNIGQSVDESFINEINNIEGNIVVMQTIEPWSKTKAAFVITQNYRLSMEAKFNRSSAQQFDEALDLIESKVGIAQTLCSYSLTIYAYAEKQQELDIIGEKLRKIAIKAG